jgi:S-adenosylmethionine decarboxylase
MIGQHLILDIKNCKNKILDDVNKCIEVFDMICNKYSFSVLNKVNHKFTPQGVSLLYLLSESHLSLHSWPEHNFLTLDCYTCSAHVTSETHERMTEDLLQAFDGEKHRFVIVERGFPSK